MRMYDIIEAKREGKELTSRQIRWFIEGYTKGEIPDYQASALMMAIYFKGCTALETAELTLAMRDSGDLADLSQLGEKTVDKHSTGGVGDKTTLVVAPIVAAVGCKLAKMSGRGLGHTGGTVDKLESIKGYNTSLDADVFLNQVNQVGIAVVGQTGNFAPADKKLYALRDVTATVNSIPLIASSIMSKKLAAGSKNIVLDVKCGSGAFMPTAKGATELAQAMVDIGKAAGRKIAALITNMNEPLGYAVGNSLEVAEAVEILRGKYVPGLSELCLKLSTQMVSLALYLPENKAATLCQEAVNSGTAYNTFIKWIKAQGGDVAVLEDLNTFTAAKRSTELLAESEGYITDIDAKSVGVVASLLGAGRENKDSEIDLTAGISLYKKCGDYVKKGEPIARLQSSVVRDFSAALSRLSKAYLYGAEKPEELPIVYNIIS